jgi:group II intron reverse transcriptase/maturase
MVLEGDSGDNNEFKADWIIRACQDRSVQGEKIGYTYPKLWQEAGKAEVSSYGFRPGRCQRQAVEAALEIVKTGKAYVADIDLSKFFDRVHHDRLISRLSLHISDKRILRIIGMTLRSGVMKDGLYSPTGLGTVQGGPLSPLLSNAVLDELDKELERRGLEFCRYADDCNIFVGSQKAAERVMSSISKFISKKLKLVVNREKSKVALSWHVKFL